MANIIDYMDWRGDVPFSVSPFNDIDNLIFTQLSFIVYALRVKGDSMINVGIHSGDIIVVKKQSHAENGQIVVALIEDEATVKTFYREKDHIRLQPENDTMQPILVKELAVLGKVVACIKYFE